MAEVSQPTAVVTPAVVVVQVGSTMSRSPGLAASILLWIVSVAAMWVGALPPTVTVTVSMDCFPLAAVITNSPHCAVEPPYCACCVIEQLDKPEGTLTLIWVSDQET